MSRVEKFGRGRISPPSNSMIEETAASEMWMIGRRTDCLQDGIFILPINSK